MSERKTGHFLKEWRQHMKMTQKEFAEYVGLSMSNYNYLEAGKVGYTQKSLEMIARALEVTPAELLSVNPMEAPEPPRGRDDWDEFYDTYNGLTSDHQQLAKRVVWAFHDHEQKKILARLRLTGDRKKEKS